MGPTASGSDTGFTQFTSSNVSISQQHPRNSVPPARWPSLNPVKLTLKIHRHRNGIISDEQSTRRAVPQTLRNHQPAGGAKDHKGGGSPWGPLRSGFPPPRPSGRRCLKTDCGEFPGQKVQPAAHGGTGTPDVNGADLMHPSTVSTLKRTFPSALGAKGAAFLSHPRGTLHALGRRPADQTCPWRKPPGASRFTSAGSFNRRNVVFPMEARPLLALGGW